MTRQFTARSVQAFVTHLKSEERAPATIKKYAGDVGAFLAYLSKRGIRSVTKQTVIEYKDHLSRRMSPRSVNAALAALGGFFAFMGRDELRVKKLRIQKQLFCPKEKELSREEYSRLVKAAKRRGNERLSLIIQTLCATGIRVSELKAIEAGSLASGRATVSNKGKSREVVIPAELCRVLRQYCKERGIRSGAVFVTKSGAPLNRSNIWADMKKLCESAGVAPEKVFPHNLRHLFARTFYALEKDLGRLADILGHSSVETTRIYTITGIESVERRINRLGLVV